MGIRLRRALVGALMLAVLCMLSGCAGGANQEAGSATAHGAAMTDAGKGVGASETAGAIANGEDLAAALAALDGVSDVKELDGIFDFFSLKYLVTFQQPLDWDDPSQGTFPQRVEVGVTPGAQATVLETDGYSLLDAALAYDDPCELAELLEANYVHVEHRFFGKSRPDGLSQDRAEGWQQLTAENAAADTHKIFQELSKVLDGPWAATGASRGGEACMAYAYYHPHDMQIYVTYAAPFCKGNDDPRMYDWIYTSIGDSKYGEAQAAEYRDLVTAFQVECMKRKSQLAPRLMERAKADGSAYRAQVTDELLFDMSVLELAVQEWQYAQDFDEMARVMALPEATQTEEEAKLQALEDLLYDVGNPSDWACNNELWAYYVGNAREYGQYRFDFSYLRAALAEARLRDNVSMPADWEDSFAYQLVFTPEQLAALPYDAEYHDGLEAWLEQTDCTLVALYGGSDPWYCQRIPDAGNDNVHVIVGERMSHDIQIQLLDESGYEAAMELITERLSGI